jgi:hypothetical protein
LTLTDRDEAPLLVEAIREHPDNVTVVAQSFPAT